MYNPYVEEEVFVPMEEASQEKSNFAPFPPENQTSDTAEGDSSDSFHQFLKIKEMIKPSDLSFFKDFLGGKKEKNASAAQSTDVLTEGGEAASDSGFLESIVKKFHLETIETGDILLVILVIYFMLEGDDKIELAITLGILAFFWWADHRKSEAS